jgi:hypothetical protein
MIRQVDIVVLRYPLLTFQHLNLVMGDVEESVLQADINEITGEEVVKVITQVLFSIVLLTILSVIVFFLVCCCHVVLMRFPSFPADC